MDKGQTMTNILRKRLSVRTHKNNFIICSFRLECAYASVDGFYPQYHPRAAPIGSVIDLPELPRAVIMQVMGLNMHNSLRLRTMNDTVLQKTADQSRHGTDDINSHDPIDTILEALPVDRAR